MHNVLGHSCKQHPKPLAASPFLPKPLDASNIHHNTAIYAGKRLHVHQVVNLFLV